MKVAQRISDASSGVEIHPQYLGYVIRKDGWSTREWDRFQDWSVLYFLDKGEIRIEHEAFRKTITPGDSVYVGSDLRPTVIFSNPIEVREVWFRFKKRDRDLVKTGVFSQIMTFRTPVEAASLVDHIAAEHAADMKQHTEFLLSFRLSLLLALCWQEVELYEESARKLSSSQRVRLVRWVQQNLASRPSPAKVADMLGLSADYFGRIFRNTFGQAPRDWLIRQRILMARRLLDEGVLSKDEVMAQCGFDNVAHFSRQMKRLTGKTPGGSRGWNHKK